MYRKIQFIIVLALLFSSLIIRAQEYGTPYLQNYLRENNKFLSQNWAITQDPRGIMYFGTSQSVVEYDGNRWHQYFIDNGVVRSLDVDSSGIIYVGGNTEFGYLEPIGIGRKKYVNLSKNIVKKGYRFSNVWKTIAIDKGAYFFTHDYIFWWDGNEVTIIEEKLNPFFASKIKEKIFVTTKRNVCLLEDSILTVLPNTDLKKNEIALNHILEFSKDELLLFSRIKGIMVYDKTTNELSSFSTEIDAYLKRNNLYSAVKIDSTRYAIGTLTGGIAIINRDGKLLQIINEDRGLASNFIFSLFVDDNGSLWAGTQKGVSRIDLNFPAVKFSKEQNIANSVLCVKTFKNRKYIGAFDGLYYLTDYELSLQKDNHIYRKLSKTAVTWDFDVIRDKLFACGRNGVFQIVDTSYKVIYSIKGSQTWSIGYNPKFPDYIFAGTENIFNAIKIDFNTSLPFVKFETIQNFPEIKDEIINIVADSDQNLWLTSKNKVYFIRFNTIDDYKITALDRQSGLPASLTYKLSFIDGQINILTSKGIFKPIFPQQNKQDSLIRFIHDKRWGARFTEDSVIVDEIIKTNENKYFILSNPELFLNNINDSISLDSSLLNKFRNQTIISASLDENGMLNLGYDNGFWVLDPNKKTSVDKPYNCLIRKVTIGRDSLIFEGDNYVMKDNQKLVLVNQTGDLIPEFEYVNNTITFEYTSAFYENTQETKYQYKLEGYSDEWSIPSKEKIAKYTRLREGDYTFKAKAINIYGNESTIASYRFTVNPPWYRASWAYLIYVIIFGLFVYLLVKFSNYRILKAKNHLEKVVKERTLEIQNKNEELLEQKGEILAQNVELDNYRNHLENLVDERTLELKIARDKAQESDKLKTAFLTNISHEIRTPMNSIMGFSQLLAEEIEDNEEVSDYIARIQKNSNDLLHLIDDIIIVARIESEQLSVNNTVLYPYEIIEELIKKFSDRYEDKMAKNSITLVNKCCDQSGRFIIESDRAFLNQILTRLIDNAFKYTQKGTIEIGLNQDGEDNIKFYVRDTGIGMDEHQISVIFDLFRKIEDDKYRLFRGAGLGLYIGQKLASKINATIHVESEPEVGSTFYLRVPTSIKVLDNESNTMKE